MNRYVCQDCGTVYSTSEDRPPPTPRWDDGHVCRLVKTIDLNDKEYFDKVCLN